MTAWLRIQAPFAAFRGLQAGVYRTSSPTMSYSAAYGLILNLASIEAREDLVSGGATAYRTGLPSMRLALGKLQDAEVCTLYQQLHSYPVGSSGKELKAKAKGQKFWIVPVRREILVGLDVVLGIDAESSFLSRLAAGLAGHGNVPRYGLPFMGDNNFLLDRADLVEVAPKAHWYTPVDPEEGPRRGSTRLTAEIDRGNSSRTRNILVAPEELATSAPPETAWVKVGSS